MSTFELKNDDIVEALRRGRTLSGPNDTELVVIPGGPFHYGPEGARCDLPAFAMARHPVTNRQWQVFMEERGYVPVGASHTDDARYLAHWKGQACPQELLDHPVVGIGLVDALAYARAYGLVVPREVEWEKAARGDDGRTFPWGSAEPDARHCRVAAESTCPIGSYPHVRTAYGCEDMIGNVSELCLPDERIGEEVRLRGSAFMRIGIDTMRVWHSRRLRVSARNYWVGFRPALRFVGFSEPRT